jgi:predicted regulator of Ras-like GTPase activity (Roadblock/LC7/MglB family)
LKNTKVEDRFLTAVEYIAEYSGLRIAVVSDHEGLVIARKSNDENLEIDGDQYAAISLDLIGKLSEGAQRITSSNAKFISIKTDTDWITINASEKFVLTVVADSGADELLSVRIQRAFDMINEHLKNRYPALEHQYNKAKGAEVKMEASHV